jgi:hypothetical protein
MLVCAPTKNRYGFLNFSDRPFNSSCLAPRQMSIWNPVRGATYTGGSLPDTWYPVRQLYWNPERSCSAENEV